MSARRPPGSERTVVPAGRPTPQPADAVGAGRAVGGLVVDDDGDGSGRDVVAAADSCDAPVETTGGGIALEARAVGPTNAGAVLRPCRAARGWGPPHAEIARIKAMAPAQSRRHTPISISGCDRVHGTRNLRISHERTQLSGRTRWLLAQRSRKQADRNYRISARRLPFGGEPSRRPPWPNDAAVPRLGGATGRRP